MSPPTGLPAGQTLGMFLNTLSRLKTDTGSGTGQSGGNIAHREFHLAACLDL